MYSSAIAHLTVGLLPASDLRLAMLLMMKGKLGSFACHFGIKCSSFCKVNIGTSMRSACSAIGYTLHKSVRMSNKLLERSVTGSIVQLCSCH